MPKYRVFYEAIGEGFNRIAYVSACEELHAKQEVIRTLLEARINRDGIFRKLMWMEEEHL